MTLGLRIRMVIALGLQAVLVLAVLALLGFLVIEGNWVLPVIILAFVWLGFLAGRLAEKRTETAEDIAARERGQARAEQALQRLCLVADRSPVPDVEVVSDPVALAWTRAPLRRPPRIELTTGLTEAVSDAELEAVVGHELGHIEHNDAGVMWVLATPAVLMLRGFRLAVAQKGKVALIAIVFGWTLAVYAALLSLTGRIVSRHRELAADGYAARVTGSPSSVASALTTLDRSLDRALTDDLRLVYERDALHILPANRRSTSGIRRLWATHPTLERRLEHLADLEREWQHSKE